MDAVTGPHLAATALLALGGAPKVWSPADTTRALRALRIPVTRPVVRLIGVAEVTTALVAVAAPGRTSALAVAGWYAVFAAVAVLALRSRAPLSSCGCFGAVESPPTPAHLVLVLAAAAAAAAYAASPSPELLTGAATERLALVALSALAAWFGYLVMTGLAALSVPRTTTGTRA